MVVDANTDDNKWLCFRVKNGRGVYGYAKYQVDLTAPEITLTQNNTLVFASSVVELTDYKHYTASSDSRLFQAVC